jgi:hypothetical protein
MSDNWKTTDGVSRHTNIFKRLKQLVMGDRVKHFLDIKENGFDLAVSTEFGASLSELR